MNAVRKWSSLPWVILGANLVVFGAGVALAAGYDAGTWMGEYTWSAGFLALALAGAVIAARRPENPVGWLLVISPLFEQLATSLETYADLAMVLRPGQFPGATVVNVLHEIMWIPSFLGILVLTMLLFPTGKLLSPRWRWVAATAITGGTLNAVVWMVGYWPVRHLAVAEVDDPTAILEPAWLRPLMFVAFPLMMIGVVGAVASLVVRSRRSSGDERAQVKWITYAAALTAAFILLGAIMEQVLPAASPLHDVGETFGVFVVPMIAAALAVSVLKYRLYDIDLVISRSLVFAGLAGFITAIYVGIVVGIGTVLGAGDEPNLALSIVATGVVAVAFQPVRELLTRLANRLVFGHRATPYEVLSRFAGDLAEAAAPERTLERMAKLVADGTGADRVLVWLLLDEAMRPTAVWPEVLLLEPIPDRPPAGQATFVDFDHVEQVTYDGQVLGAITLTESRGEALNHTEQELLRDLAGQAALVLRNLRLTEELRERVDELHRSRERIVRAQDAERRRLERDLHDGAQQQLASLIHQVEQASATATRERAEQSATMLRQVADDGQAAIDTIRDLAHGIYPPLLAAEGLSGALQAQAAKAAVPVVVEGNAIGRYSQDVEAAVYFCVLEALTNAAKYASPSRITVQLAQTDNHLTFNVIDDGVGFDPSAQSTGRGTANMADRLDALGGGLQLESRPGHGTRVCGHLPFDPITSEVSQ